MSHQLFLNENANFLFTSFMRAPNPERQIWHYEFYMNEPIVIDKISTGLVSTSNIDRYKFQQPRYRDIRFPEAKLYRL
jgi:hypothetical protein